MAILTQAGWCSKPWGAATVAWGILAAGVVNGGREALKWCLRNPGCRATGIGELAEGAEALAEAFGIRPPSGSSLSSAGATGGAVGIVSGGVGALAQNIGKVLTEIDPGDVGDSDGGDKGPGDEDPFGNDQDAKDSKQVKTRKRADEVARDLGYENAHDLKDGLGGSEVDIYVNNGSGNVYLIPKNNVGWEWVGRLF